MNRAAVKFGVPLAAGTALLAAAIFFRDRSPADPAKASASLPVPVAVPTPHTVSSKTVAALVERRALQEAQRVSGRPLTAAQRAELQAREGEIERLGDELGAALEGSVGAWRELIDVLAPLRDFKVLLQVVEIAEASLADASESAMIEAARSHAAAPGRLAAVTLLGACSSRESLAAIVSAAEGDADGNVRAAALRALGRRKWNSPDPASAVLIEETLKRRNGSEPDAGVRQIAADYLPGGRPPMPPAPKPQHKGGKRPRTSSLQSTSP